MIDNGEKKSIYPNITANPICSEKTMTQMPQTDIIHENAQQLRY